MDISKPRRVKLIALINTWAGYLEVAVLREGNSIENVEEKDLEGEKNTREEDRKKEK